MANETLTIPGDFLVNARVEEETLVVRQTKKVLKVLVSSTVYGREDFLSIVYQLLSSMGFDVEMSAAGTLKTTSSRTAFENCLAAVERCDLFLGIITTAYGSGLDPVTGKSITHLEINKAIELKKPRWMLVDAKVPFMRNWLRKMNVKTRQDRAAFMKLVGEGFNYTGKDPFSLGKMMFDLRTIDMYEDAMIDFEGPNSVPLEERKGNWVQPYTNSKEINRFVVSQFSNCEEALGAIKGTFHAA